MWQAPGPTLSRLRPSSPNCANIRTYSKPFWFTLGSIMTKQCPRRFFATWGIPRPDVFLEVGSGSHAQQTAEIMRRFEPVLLKVKPDFVLVVGDVNSTVACALTAAKLHIGVIHVEAGLRSFDREMPEEVNRVSIIYLADLLFVTEKSGRMNLLKEGIAEERIHFVGNVMTSS